MDLDRRSQCSFRVSDWSTKKNAFNRSYINGLKGVELKKKLKKMPRGDLR